jgi:CHASE2 domain-containing sensor protein
MKGVLLVLEEKGARYWITALVILVLATIGSPYVYEELHLTNARSYFFQRLLEWGPRPVEPKFVTVLLIEDEEYWKGDLAGRRPIKRDYVAKLVDNLVLANARVIALDFDTRLPDPHQMIIPKDYREETAALVQAIERAAQHGKKVILAAPISYNAQGLYQRDADVYQANHLCENEDEKAWRKNITCGYIALPDDPLIIPSRLPMAESDDLDSFALAVARATQPELITRLLKRTDNHARYANFISQATFKSFNAELSAGALLNGSVDADLLDSRSVIVGAHWSRDAAGRGPRVDLHWTPVGFIVGAELHANFAEALLDARVFRSTPEWILKAIEIGFSLLAAVAFAAFAGVRGKIASISVALAFLFVLQWLMLHGFGIFLDVFVPLVGLGLHSVYERLWASEE